MDADTFWELYEAKLVSDGMNPRAVEWARKRVAYFIDKTKRVRLRDKTAEDIRAYLCKQVAAGRMEDWQFGQLVDGLRVLFVRLVKSPWAEGFPWEKWKSPHLSFGSEIEHYAHASVDLHAGTPKEKFRDTLDGMKTKDLFGDELNAL